MVFKNIVGDDNVIIDQDTIQTYNTDFTKKYKGSASLVLTPVSKEQVAEVLRHCNERNLAVTPQGGNTGLVGGSVPLHDEIIISLKKLDQVVHFDPETGVLRCEAGCILENLQNYVKQFGYVMPLDQGAKRSCMIGGKISTNAADIKFNKYG